MPRGVYIRTDATRLALSVAQRGKTIPQEIRDKISDGLKKVACMSRFNPGHVPSNKRDWTTIDEAIRSRYPEEGGTLASILGVSIYTLYLRASYIGVKSERRMKATDEFREEQSARMSKIVKSPEWKANISSSLKGRSHSTERVEAIVRGVTKARSKKKSMTKPEKWVSNILILYFGSSYRDTIFTGNGAEIRTLNLSGKRRFPDFLCESQRKIIEVFGRYWHRDDDPDEVICQYQSAGWECLIIWDDEIGSSAVDRIHKFLYPYEYEEELKNVNHC